MDSMNECVIEWIKGEKRASVTLPRNTRLANKIRNLAKTQADCLVLADENGALFAHVPVEWVKISPKRQASESQKAAAAENIKKAMQAKQSKEAEA